MSASPACLHRSIYVVPNGQFLERRQEQARIGNNFNGARIQAEARAGHHWVRRCPEIWQDGRFVLAGAAAVFTMA
jgi:hypothetical protein